MFSTGAEISLSYWKKYVFCSFGEWFREKNPYNNIWMSWQEFLQWFEHMTSFTICITCFLPAVDVFRFQLILYMNRAFHMAFPLSFCLFTQRTSFQRQRQFVVLSEANFSGNLGKLGFSLNFLGNCFVLLLSVVWGRVAKSWTKMHPSNLQT